MAHNESGEDVKQKIHDWVREERQAKKSAHTLIFLLMAAIVTTVVSKCTRNVFESSNRDSIFMDQPPPRLPTDRTL